MTSPAQIKGLYLTQPVYAGEQLSLKRFALPSEQGVRAKLTGTQRALQVPGTTDQLLVGTLLAGDRVDVVASLKASAEQRRREIGCRVAQPPGAPDPGRQRRVEDHEDHK